MARADAASASLRSDSIKGLAESIANPAYRRLLSAEPLLRRAVPVLIIAFMVTICIGAAVEVLGPLQPLTTFGAEAGTREIVLGNGEPAFAAVRALRNPTGLLTVIQARDDALANWRSITALTITLSATTGFVVLILGFAFHWQATRAREADLITNTSPRPGDPALKR